MKTNLTDKDKRLLMFMLMFVIIVAIGYWGVIPQISGYSELAEKIETEEEKQKVNKMKISNAATVEFQLDEYKEKIKQVKDEFYGIMKSSQVDKMLTQLATKRNLSIYDLKFNMPKEPTTRMAYVNSALYQEQLLAKEEYNKKAADEEDSSKSKSSEDKDSSSDSAASVMESAMGAVEGGYAPNTDIYAVPVSFSVGGELSDLEAFLEELNHFDKRVLMVGYSWGTFRVYLYRDANGNLVSNIPNASAIPVTEGVSVNSLLDDDKVRKSLTVKLEIYMCDTTMVESSDSTDADTADETVSE